MVIFYLSIGQTPLKRLSTKDTKTPCGRGEHTNAPGLTTGIPKGVAAGCGPKKPFQPPPPWPVARDRGPQVRMPCRRDDRAFVPLWVCASCPLWRSLLRQFG